jgi:molybdate transport system ATP-binding protein
MSTVEVTCVVRQGDFTLDIATTLGSGSVVAVLGPNGAGKTTLLRTLAGLLAVDEGRVVISGSEVDGPSGFVPPQHRAVGVVFQDYALFPHLTVLENTAFGPRARGAGRRPSREAAMRTLASLGVADLADRRPADISGGQAQRVALARALATDPQLLLLDEPLAALDVETRENVRTELDIQLAAFHGCAVIVTHDPLDAMLLADRVIVLENGRIVQDATPAER